MSYIPFDGVLLDDQRPVIPGAFAMVLHIQTAEHLGTSLNRDAIEARSSACRELLEHGLFPSFLRALSDYGLELGSPDSQHSLVSVIDHLELYLEAVSTAGYIEPCVALWDAVSAELDGRRGLWSERTHQDGPLEAGLKDLQPVRLRALACLPHLGGAVFRLATRRGGQTSGLFGGGQPLVDWFLDGLETHGQTFAADLQLAEPEGWGDAPWSKALDSLFEGVLDLNGHEICFQRGLVDSPFDLLRCGVEQTVAWVLDGIAPHDIALIHPKPETIRETLETLLGAEGVPLASKGSLRPLIQSQVWSPIWSFLNGLLHLDPCAAAMGLNVSKRSEARMWAEALAVQDQSGQAPFEACIAHLPERIKPNIEELWRQLLHIRSNCLSPVEWGEILNDLITSKLRFPVSANDYYAPMGLLRECWAGSRFFKAAPRQWDFDHMMRTLRAFLESARSSDESNSINGVRLVSPSELLDDWNGAEATLILDLSEGSWPARPVSNPDLDWVRRGTINAALLKASANYRGTFPPAMQRFWLPRAEHSIQIPRVFQRDAYGFNKVLAMTKQRLTALSPAQDESGRNVAQGSFWTAIEGAAKWQLDSDVCASNLRWYWNGCRRTELADDRSKSARAIGTDALFVSGAPSADLMPGLRAILQNQTSHISPTVLESMARCPFRTIAERVWRLEPYTGDMASRVSTFIGTIMHRILQSLFQPVLGASDWPEAFQAHNNLTDAEIAPLENLVHACWQENKENWLAEETRLSSDQLNQALQRIESLLPNIAAYIKNDMEAACPTIAELAFLFPATIEPTAKANSKHALMDGWRRSIIGLEHVLGPIDLSVGDDKTICVAGVADRIELWEHTVNDISFLRVTDYKTSTKTRLNAYAADDAPFTSHLQTPLYVWMAMETFRRSAASVLIPLRESAPVPFANHMKPLAESNSDGIQWQHKLARTLARLDARIECGDFPPTPGDHCQHCKYSALCARPVDITAFDDGDDD